jgi:hypothetical protein
VSTFAERLTIRAEKYHLLEISFCINGSLPFGGRRGDEGIGQILHGKRGKGDITATETRRFYQTLFRFLTVQADVFIINRLAKA